MESFELRTPVSGDLYGNPHVLITAFPAAYAYTEGFDLRMSVPGDSNPKTPCTYSYVAAG